MSTRDLSISEKILALLASGPRTKAKLLEEITADATYTPQGFYKALAQLREDAVITLHEESVSLSFIWIQKEFDRISKIASVYKAPVYQSYFGTLTPGEKVSYRFKNLRELELFWTHAIFVVVEGAPEHVHLISLTPHDWFQKLLPETNYWWRTITTNHPHWAILTHATGEEMRMTQYPTVQGFERMAGENPLHQKESAYVNIVGDLIFDVKLDEQLVPEIQKLVRGEPVDHTALLDMPGIFKLSIERNPTKARSIQKKLKKYFTIPLS